MGKESNSRFSLNHDLPVF